MRGAQKVASRSSTVSFGGRPVVLLTFDVPVTAEAARLAVDAAVESGQPLLVVNVVEMPIRPMTASWGQEIVVAEDVEQSLRAPAELAHDLAVKVERIRLVSPRPALAVLELLAEHRPGLVVLGATRSRMGRRLRRTERRIRDAAACLVWSDDGAAA